MKAIKSHLPNLLSVMEGARTKKVAVANFGGVEEMCTHPFIQKHYLLLHIENLD